MKKLFICMIALAMVGMFTASAMAEVDLYGSARMWTFSNKVSKEANDNKFAAGFASPTPGDFEDTDTFWALGAFSRFGATFKNGDVGGKFELDGRMTSGKSASSVGSLRMRHLYGTWNFGSGELLVGQTWPITDQPVAGLQFSADGMQSYGGVGAADARIPQIRLTFGGFKIGFLSPDVYAGLKGSTSTTYDLVIDPDKGVTSTTTGFTDTDVTLPKIEASFDLPLGDMGSLTAFGGYQTYDMEDNAESCSESVTSYVVGLRGKFNFGPAYVNAIVNYGQNPVNYGEAMGPGVDGYAIYDTDDEKVIDYKNLGFVLVAGFKINDMLSAEVGYGMDKGEWDATDAPEQEHSAYYIQLPITLAPGVRVVPEIAKFDFGETKFSDGDKTDQGDQTTFGAVWYISF